MLKQLLLAVFVVGCVVHQPAPTFAAALDAQFFPYTGEVRLINKSPVAPVPIIFYSIESATSALISAEWNSIDDNYDVSGNGLIDPNGEWQEIESSAMELTEGSLDADGGRFPPQRAISLGRIWNPATTPVTDFTFTALETDNEEDKIEVSRELALDGDYVPDRIVNQSDYNIWRQYLGSTSVLLADGNIDGVVDAADYVVWRNNLGLLITPATSDALLSASSSSVRTVPEPAAALLAMAALAGLYLPAHRIKRSR